MNDIAVTLPVAPITAPTIGSMLDRALTAGRTATELKELLDVYERMQAREAEQVFNTSLAAFQNEAKTIAKNRMVDFVSKAGGRVKYGFTDFESLLDQIRPLLSKHGFSFSHDTAVDEKQYMSVTCTLRHVAGHRERSAFTLPTTAQTSLMSDQQRYAAALTFARRYTLITILGLATGDADPDDVADPTTISESQAAQIINELTAVGADIVRFKKYMGVSIVEEIRLADLPKAQAAIESKRRTK